MPLYNNIYILGGQELAVNYHDKLMAAKRRGELSFQNIFCVSDAPSSRAASHLPKDQVISKSASRFIRDYVFLPQEERHDHDTLIPDHTAKHVLLQAYLELVRENFPQYCAELAPFHADFQTPFLRKSENDAIWAMSYATWLCPPDCAEPATCPHTNAPRDWNFFSSLPRLMKEFPDTDYDKHLFGCEPLYAEISQIPLRTIVAETKNLMTRLENSPPQNVIVATHSHCHGILGQFGIRFV